MYILTENGSDLDIVPMTEMLELPQNIYTKYYSGSVIHMDSNDKYLVSGSFDNSCMVWKLPDFKPIQRLTPTSYSLIFNSI